LDFVKLLSSPKPPKKNSKNYKFFTKPGKSYNHDTKNCCRLKNTRQNSNMAQQHPKSLAKYPAGVKLGRPEAWKAAFEAEDRKVLAGTHGWPQILVQEHENPANMPNALLSRLLDLRARAENLTEDELIDLKVLEKIYSIVEAAKMRLPA
jgi:hypothetical protein